MLRGSAARYMQPTRNAHDVAGLEATGAMASHIPLGRVSPPEEHTGLYVLLASPRESAYVTGAILQSDGGLTLGV